MKLIEYLEMAFAAAVPENSKVKKISLSEQLRILREIFMNSEVSDSLGFNIPDELLKKAKAHAKVKSLSPATENDLKAPGIPASIKKSSAEIWKLALKDGNIIFFKRTGAGEIGSKSLTPDKLGLTSTVSDKFVDKKFSKQALVKATIAAINKKPYTENLKKFITSIIEAAGKSKIVSKIPEGSKTANVLLEIKDFQERSSKFDPGDMNNVWKDLGEVLSAIISCEGDNGAQVYFPKEINRPLVDFFTELGNGEIISFSAKAIKKASDGTGKPSITGLLSYIKANDKILKDDTKEKEFYTLVKLVDDIKGVPESYIALAEHKYLDVIKAAKTNYKARTGKEYKGLPEEKVNFAYSCFMATKEKLNLKYKDTLTSIVNAKVNVDQVYLVAPKPNGLVFSFKKFKDMSFRFDASASPKTVEAKMGFTAVLSQKDFAI